jgi:hypothetical protein
MHLNSECRYDFAAQHLTHQCFLPEIVIVHFCFAIQHFKSKSSDSFSTQPSNLYHLLAQDTVIFLTKYNPTLI